MTADVGEEEIVEFTVYDYAVPLKHLEIRITSLRGVKIVIFQYQVLLALPFHIDRGTRHRGNQNIIVHSQLRY